MARRRKKKMRLWEVMIVVLEEEDYGTLRVGVKKLNLILSLKKYKL